jgi:hypothetical protein
MCLSVRIKLGGGVPGRITAVRCFVYFQFSASRFSYFGIGTSKNIVLIAFFFTWLLKIVFRPVDVKTSRAR